MKLEYYIITIGNVNYDLPKDMPVPQNGNIVFINDKTAIVKNVHYHIEEGRVHSIYIKTIS